VGLHEEQQQIRKKEMCMRLHKDHCMQYINPIDKGIIVCFELESAIIFHIKHTFFTFTQECS